MDGSQARALLGVPVHATKDQIGRAFRGAAFGAHPDRGGDACHLRALVRAREVLLASACVPAPVRPAAYDIAGPRRSQFSRTDVTRTVVAATTVIAQPRFEDVLEAALAA